MVNFMYSVRRRDIAEALGMRAPEFVDEAMSRLDGARMASSGASPLAYISQAPAAIAALFDYFTGGLSNGMGATAIIPVAVLAQVRLAAASSIPLDRLLQRTADINSLLSVYVLTEADRLRVVGEPLLALVRIQAYLYDRLVDAVAEEYRRGDRHSGEVSKDRLALVRSLLMGELVDVTGWGYDFADCHTALIAEGIKPEVPGRLGEELNVELLTVWPGRSLAWSWIPGHQQRDAGAIESALRRVMPGHAVVALGHSECGRTGWRQSHLQAEAAFPVALRVGGVIQYGEAMLVAALLNDRVSAKFLRQHYLGPIKSGPQGGAVLLDTLRSYLAAGRNGVSTSAALSVSRQTVANRLHAVEQLLDRRLVSCLPELELALRLDRLDEQEVESPREIVDQSSAYQRRS
jgi:PucR C-terminal helix-turn-helix domain